MSVSPARKKTKWTPEDDKLIIDLCASGMKWKDISKNFSGRSATSCRLHYQNYLERNFKWDENKKNQLALVYDRLKSEIWGPLAAELGIPWRAAEAMHWQLGEADMARRAGTVHFPLAASQGSPTLPPVPRSSIHYGDEGPLEYGTGYGRRRGDSLPRSHGAALVDNVTLVDDVGMVRLPHLAEMDRAIAIHRTKSTSEDTNGPMAWRIQSGDEGGAEEKTNMGKSIISEEWKNWQHSQFSKR